METDKLIEALLGCMGRTDCRKCPILGQCNGTFDSALHVTIEHIKAQAVENATLHAQIAEKDKQLPAAVITRPEHVVSDYPQNCPDCGASIKPGFLLMDMPRCGKCGAKIDDAANKFCGKCGTGLVWPERGPQEAGEVEQC